MEKDQDALNKTVLIGEIVKPHGVKGELKVYPLTDRAERFLDLREVLFAAPASAGRSIPAEARKVVQARVVKGMVYLLTEGITNCDEAEKYRGFEVRIDRSAVPPLTDRWYYFELEGMHVFDRGVWLGVLEKVLATGANDVYLVRGPRGDICVPALKTVVRQVDVPNKRMDVVLPLGLIDDPEDTV